MNDVITGDDGLARPAWAATDSLLQRYYDEEWGMPVTDESGIFERIALEGFQSGLSWATILRKRPAFRRAFADFDADTVAAYTEADVERLLQDEGIIRNRSKIEATIRGAQATQRLRDEGGLARFVWQFQPEMTPIPRTGDEVPTQSPESVALSKALKKAGFSYVGPVTCYALMSALGMVDLHLASSHRRGASGLWNHDGSRARDPFENDPAQHSPRRQRRNAEG